MTKLIFLVERENQDLKPINAYMKGGDIRMRIKQLTKVMALSGALVMAGAGSVLADDATITNTGSGSTNIVTYDNDNTSTVNNTNDVTVTNTNDQTAIGGDIDATANTNAGNLSTGDTWNSNSFSTAVAIGNGVAASANAGVGGGTGSGAGAGSGGAAAAAGQGGGSTSALAAAGGLGGGSLEAGSLPEVGCESICDVSSLRDGFTPFGAEMANALQQNKGLSGALLSLAALLSIIGAAGSAMYAGRRSEA